MSIKATTPGYVLIINDDAPIRPIRRVLTRAGFFVLDAESLSIAEGFVKAYGDKICLVILNIVMPKASELDFASQFAAEHPTDEILYISGVEGSVIADAIRRVRPGAILTSPFTPKELVSRVRQLAAFHRETNRYVCQVQHN
jgi:DNA-binding response OmpR family regulator